MKRRDFIKVTGIGVAGAASIAAPAIAQSMPELKWRMPTSWPKSLDTLHGGAEMMAKKYGLTKDQIDEYAYNSHQKAIAATQGRDFLIPDDVKAAAPSILRHRMMLKPEADLEGIAPDQVIAEVLSAIAVPK